MLALTSLAGSASAQSDPGDGGEETVRILKVSGLIDPVTARGIDALIEGLVMHMTLSTAAPRTDTRTIVAAYVRNPR